MAALRPARAAALVAAVFPAALAAQRPAVSPLIARLWTRDTVAAVWLFVRPTVPLDSAVAYAQAAGARVRHRSRWLHALSADAPTAALRRLAGDAAYQRIQLVGRWRRRPGTPRELAPAATAQPDTCAAAGDPVHGPSEMPYRLLNVRPLADRGVDGAGVRIALLDAGFNTASAAFAGVRVVAERDFVFGDDVVRDEPADQPGAQGHGTAVWSLLAGSVPGRLRGIAPGASYLLAKTEDVRSETPVEEDNYVAALEWADSIGVDIVSSSLAYLVFDPGFRSYGPSDLTGDVAVTTVAADAAAQRGILVATAAGNSGPPSRSVETPADADSAVAVGAEDSLGQVASFSSRGPTADGRIKPDLTAPGVDVCALLEDGVRRFSGTSFSTPLVAGAAALVKQLHPGLGGVALADALRRHAGNRLAPDTIRGWGRPDATASAVFPLGITVLEPIGSTLGSITPTFRWSAGDTPAFARPVSFRVRIARDSTLAQPVVDTVVIDLERYELRRPQKPGPALYWRVDATAASGEQATTGLVGPLEVPAWATLLTLNDPAGATTADAQPTLAWRPTAVSTPPAPLRYDVVVQPRSSPQPNLVFAGVSDTSFRIPVALERNAVYRWLLVVHAGADTSAVVSAGTFVILDDAVPATTLLHQNFPNPFPTADRAYTCLWFDLAQPARVDLAILDLRGRAVRRLIPGPDLSGVLPPGRYGRGAAGGPACDTRLVWDGTADDGRIVPAGVYLYRLRAGSTTQFKRIVFRGRSP